MENIAVVIGIAAIIAVAVYAAYYFLNLEKSKQLEIVQEWLLLAVVQAEKELGGGTGAIKLRFVYDLFLNKFAFLAKLITFDQFSIMVDGALDKMKDMLSNNEQLYNYITQPN